MKIVIIAIKIVPIEIVGISGRPERIGKSLQESRPLSPHSARCRMGGMPSVATRGSRCFFRRTVRSYMARPFGAVIGLRIERFWLLGAHLGPEEAWKSGGESKRRADFRL